MRVVKATSVGVLLLALSLTAMGAVPAVVATGDRQFQGPPPGLPGQGDCVWGQATQLVVSAVQFLCVEGYEPWAAMIVEPGLTSDVDRVSITFDGSTLRIEVEDEGTNRNLVILVNKAFADEHLDSAESNLDIRTSDAVNYDGLSGAPVSVPSGIGGPFYVFIITGFSTQWLEMSTAFPLLLVVGGVVAAVVVIGAVVIFLRRRR